MQKRLTHVSYDEVPYDGGIASATHPQTAAVIARLFGLHPPPVTSARVLEIGCGSGGNLVPMAYSLPGASFLGIDLSATHIERATTFARRLGLTNVTFTRANVSDFVPPGEFDYIICHGVFSWVPPETRSAILDVCRDSLAPHGVAHISYNVFPGWHTRGALREMMKFHARFFPDPSERVEQARAFASFLADATAHFEGTGPAMAAYSLAMRSEYEIIRDRPDYYVMHEHLAEVNDPLYFLDFSETLGTHALRYLGDSRFSTMVSENLPEDVESALDRISPSSEILEQYRDFVLNRTFRQSLVVRGDAPVDRRLNVAAIPEFTVRATIFREPSGPWRVPQAGDLSREVHSPLVVSVLEILADASPFALAFEELRSRIPQDVWPADILPDQRDAHLSSLLLSLFACDALELRLWNPPIAREAAENPRVFGPALYADHLRGTPGPHHFTYGFDPIVAWLIPLMNGTVSRNRLVDLVVARIDDGSLVFSDLPDGALPGRTEAELLVSNAIEQLRQSGLLEPSPSAPQS